MIKSLTLDNFKKHEHLEVEFTDGLNLITGPNYSGKTTILYGILYALGGAAQVPGTNLQTMGTNAGSSVEMEFEIDGACYVVSRKKTGAFLYSLASGQRVQIASGTTPVNEAISRLIGMPLRYFKTLKYAEQKKAHALLSSGASELHAILEELTGVGHVNGALVRLKDIVVGSEGALEAVPEGPPPADLQEDLERLRDEFAEAQTSEALAKSTAKSVEERYRAAQEVLLSMDKRKQQHDRYAAWEQEKKALLSATLADLDRLGPPVEDAELDALRVSASRLDAEAEALRERERGLREKARLRERLESDAEDAASRVGKADRAWQTASAASTEAQAKVEALRSKGQPALDEIPSLAAALEFGKAESARISRALRDGVCSACKRPLSDAAPEVTEADVAAADAAVQAALGALESAKRIAREYTSVVAVAESATATTVKAEEALSRAKADFTRASEALEREGPAPLPGQAEELSDEVESKSVQAAELRDQIAGVVRNNREVSRLSARRDDILAEMANEPPPAAYDEDEHRVARGEVRDAGEDVGNAKEAVSDARLKRSLLEKSVAAAAIALEAAQSRAQQRESILARLGTAKALQKYLKDNRDRYAAQVWEYFLSTASRFVSDCTAGAISEIRRGEDGRFTYVEGGYEMGIKDASGAQEALLGMGVQVALAGAAACPLDVLLVDEPTADMDAEHSMATFAMLSSTGRQVVAISHREMDTSLCRQMIAL